MTIISRMLDGRGRLPRRKGRAKALLPARACAAAVVCVSKCARLIASWLMSFCAFELRCISTMCCRTPVLLLLALLLAAYGAPLQHSSRNTASYFTAFKVSK